jgi:hypothetical protein
MGKGTYFLEQCPSACGISNKIEEVTWAEVEKLDLLSGMNWEKSGY